MPTLEAYHMVGQVADSLPSFFVLEVAPKQLGSKHSVFHSGPVRVLLVSILLNKVKG
jgi:hypothetical protein